MQDWKNFHNQEYWLFQYVVFNLFYQVVVFSFDKMLYCQAQGQGQGRSQSQSQKSKLDPEVGYVMGWFTHHPPPDNFFWA